MEEKIIRTIHLDNNQNLNIYDYSRKVAQDSWQVKLILNITIKVDPALFSDVSKLPVKIEDIKKKVGNEVVYEVKLERNFINDSEKDDVLEALISSFLSTNLQYISKGIFPEKFIIKKFCEKKF